MSTFQETFKNIFIHRVFMTVIKLCNVCCSSRLSVDTNPWWWWWWHCI